MKNEIYKAYNAITRKMETINLDEAEIVPGMRIVKMFWCQSANTYVSVPGASLFVVDANLQLVIKQ